VFYSTTPNGANPKCGCGEVFKFTPGSSGPDQGYKILHHFGPSRNGWNPNAGVLVDADGTIYGTTSGGGRHDAGTIFKITSGGDFSVLYHFNGNFGGGPQGELLFGKDGAIYGTTFGNGKYNRGSIFRITKGGDFTKLYDFLGVDQPGGSHDGADPQGALALGEDGTIYGTTESGGSPSGYGSAWSLSPPKGSNKKWHYEQLQIFGSDGNLPHSGLVIDPGGNNLYGTAGGGGAFQSGVIYKFTRVAPGKPWKYVLLHSFKARDKDGDIPYGNLVLRHGVLYGTNLSGGKVTNSGDCRDGCGTVFQFKL
jgi:uncharacterized repeat protein (TIGR03803 family)